MGDRSQLVVIGQCNVSMKDIFHKIMHVLGRYHEHQRHDRSSHVIINWDNVKEGEFWKKKLYAPVRQYNCSQNCVLLIFTGLA